MMKTNFNPFHSALVASLIAVFQGDAAVLVVDDFATGGFSVSESYPTVRESGLSLPIGENITRLASGDGNAYWHATSNPQNGGTMNYTLELRGAPPYGVNYLDIGYTRGGGLGLFGNAFSITIAELIGNGEIMVYSGASPVGTPISIPSVGDLLLPYDLLNTTIPIDRLNSLHFRFIGLSKDFSVTVDRIAAVPEASGASLALLGGAMLLFRRRRTTAVTPRQA